MSNLKIFIASSLRQFEDERKYLKGLLSDMPNVKDVYMCEAELTAEVGRVNDTQKDLINPNLIESDLVIFLLGSKVGHKTVEEFDLAMSMRSRLHIYVLYNPVKACSPEDGMPYEEFYRNKMTDRVDCQDGSVHFNERYVNVWKDDNTLRELAMRAVNHSFQYLLRTSPCSELSYDDFIPDTQSSRRNSCRHYFHRPEIDGELKACLSDETRKRRFVLLSGPSTSGKTMAACRAIRELNGYQVYAVNSNSLDRDLSRLCPKNSPTIFDTGKIILLLDDVQDILWKNKDDYGKYERRVDKDVIQRLMNIENPDFHIVATSYMDDVDQIKRFFGSNDSNSAYISIKPLSRNELKVYADQLQAYGYMVKDGGHGMTLGSLFINLDRICEDLEKAMVNDINDLTIGTATAQVCDAIKTIWMWKNNSRKDYGRLLYYLQYTYPSLWQGEIESRSQMKKVFERLRNLVIYNGAESFEVDEIIVNSVFRFYYDGSEYNEDKAAEAATERLFGFFLNAEYKDELGEGKLFKNCTKTQQMSSRYSFGKKVRDKLQKLLCSKYGVDNIFKLNKEEKSDNKVGEKVDWVKIFASNFIMMAKNDQIAYNIWKDCASDNVAGTLFLLKKLKDAELRAKVYDKFFDKSICRDKNVFDPYKEYKDSIEYSLKMELCSFNGVSMETAKKVFEGLPSINEVKKTEENKTPVVLDELYDDSYEEDYFYSNAVENQDAITETAEPQRFENMEPAQKFFAKMTRRMCQILMMKTMTWEDFSRLVDYLMANGKGFVPSDKDEFLFQYIDKYTWKRWISALGSEQDAKEAFANILACEIEHRIGAVETPMYLEKKYVLNNILESSCEATALQLWAEMSKQGCFDSYTLHVLLSKVSDFGIAKGVFESFMETPGARLVKVGEIVLNDLLSKTKTWSGIKECEQLFRNYELIGKDEKITDIGFSEHTQGILHSQMTYDEIREHLLKHRPEENENGRSTATMIHLLLKAPDYQTSKEIIFGKWKEEWGITPHEQKVLRSSPYAVSLVFRNCRSAADGIDAKNLFEGLCNATIPESDLFKIYDSRQKKTIYLWNTNFYMGHVDGNILNEVINNDFIYSDLNVKQTVVEESRQKKYTVNVYAEKHILLRKIRKEKNLDKKLALIAKEIPGADGVLRIFLIGAMMEYVLKKTMSLSGCYDFPVPVGGVWQNKEMTVNEYAVQMFDEGYIEGYALFYILNYADKSESVDWQKRAMDKGVQLDYAKYQTLKHGIVEKPYLLVKDYALFKDVCYKLRHYEFSFEDAEAYIKEVENAKGISVSRTDIYWNVVISSISFDKSIRRSEKWKTIKDFMSEHALSWNSERFYSALHVISSKEDFEELRVFYSKDMTASQILAAVNQLKNVDEIDTCKYKTQIAIWFSSEFEKWYETLKKIDGRTEDYDRIKDSVIDSLYYEPLIQEKYEYGQKRMFVQWTFMFYWILGFALVRDQEQRKEMEDILCRQYFKYFSHTQSDLSLFMHRLAMAKSNGKYPYPADLIPEIKAIIESRIK